MPKDKQRLDLLLVERALCTSRQQAQRLIRAGAVKVGDRIVDKPGTVLALSAVITVKQKPPYVSRGGEKLAKALAQFDLDVRDRSCLDGGISTGGFTDCLLQAGAKQVFGVDVGYGQVAWQLRQNPRVILKERTNLRYLTAQDLYGGEYGGEAIADLGVIDVSFISLTKVLPAMWQLLREPRDLVALIKPQFEVGRERVGKQGVVRDSVAQAEAIAQVLAAAVELGWQVQGLTYSPLTGPAGNVEYLTWLGQCSQPLPTLNEIKTLTQTAMKSLLRSTDAPN
ncbi:MAG: TlyA family RNA methyltransferase [Cyanobacteria bacterium P01_G01_bin.54]